mmetsp:Transcript_4822/g.7426  ORF Transcript_4822/g.7426 Transcript_4822/m.7426 type:complete len:477 (-) Transcript_4822:58-1488(-)
MTMLSFKRYARLALASSALMLGSCMGEEQATTAEYGVDVSFPIHHMKISENYDWLPHNTAPAGAPTPKKYEGMPLQPLGNRQAFYDNLIDSCRKHYGDKGRRCDQTERDRVDMSLRQPQSMQNYTELGFKKIKAPEKVFKLLAEFWEKNKNNRSPENWGAGNTYVNHWSSPSTMVSVENKKLRGAGPILKQAIWDAARTTLEEWTGQRLTQTSLYGVRVYSEGSVLATHVDRLPLVTSCIINVDQDVDEPWPIEVYAHDGKAYNVTMEPGDMVLYESHSVLHGRPFPLKGRYYANVFIHFEPEGHSLRHNAKVGNANVDEKYKKDSEKGLGGHEADQNGLPPYIIPGSPEESNWRRQHPKSRTKEKVKSFQTGTTTAHMAAQEGDLEALRTLVEGGGDHLIHAKDSNGWTPLHEGVRSGSLEVVEYLVKKGSKLNERTNSGVGGTPLWWATKEHGENSAIADLLKSMGAVSIGPEL